MSTRGEDKGPETELRGESIHNQDQTQSRLFLRQFRCRFGSGYAHVDGCNPMFNGQCDKLSLNDNVIMLQMEYNASTSGAVSSHFTDDVDALCRLKMRILLTQFRGETNVDIPESFPTLDKLEPVPTEWLIETAWKYIHTALLIIEITCILISLALNNFANTDLQPSFST